MSSIQTWFLAIFSGYVVIIPLNLVIKCHFLFLNTNMWPFAILVTAKFTGPNYRRLAPFCLFAYDLGLHDPNLVLNVIHLRKTNFLTISLKTFVSLSLVCIILA